MADRKLIIGVDVQIGQSKTNLEQLRDAAVKFGTDGAKYADGLTRSLQGTEKAIDSYERKLTETGNVGERDIVRIVRAIEAMKVQGEAAFGSLANAPKAFQDALAASEKKLQEASTTVGKLNNAVRDNKAHVEAASNQWSGLGSALEGIGGKTGKVVGGIGLITAAFSEGWAIGMKLNHLFGTDMALWEESVARFGSKLGAMVRAHSDTLISVVNIVKSLVTGNLSELRKSVSEFMTNVKSEGKTVSDVVTKWGSDWDKLHPSIKQTEEAMKLAKDAAEALTEKKKKLAEEIAHVVQNLKAENDELNKQKRVAEDAKLKAFELGGDVGFLGRQVKAATEALSQQQEEVAKLTQRYGENDPMTIGARQHQEELERALRVSTQRYESANSTLQVYKQQQKDAEQASAQLQEKITEQAAEQKKLEQQTRNVGKSTADVTAATQAHTTAVSAASGALVVYKDEHGRVHIEMKKVADIAPVVASGIEKVTESITGASAALAGADGFAVAARAIKEIGDNMERAVKLTPDFVSAMGDITVATQKAAGGQHLSMAQDN